ncbi:hypothetical protein Sm713_24510 [Streptomyces sp. TS71-3]|nr:hypothetical protein Sm713_24510 [Streptomyces sp. TS71-3]
MGTVDHVSQGPEDLTFGLHDDPWRPGRHSVRTAREIRQRIRAYPAPVLERGFQESDRVSQSRIEFVARTDLATQGFQDVRTALPFRQAALGFLQPETIHRFSP